MSVAGEPGYKETALGWIPENWEATQLASVAEVNPSRTKPRSDTDDVSFLTMGDVSESGRVISKQVRPYQEVAKGFTSFIDGDVLVAKITPCFENGKGALVSSLLGGIGFGSTEFHVIRAFPDSVIPTFLYLHTRADVFRRLGEKNMVGSAGQKRVPAEFLRQYPMVLPPLPEQQKIAAILTAVDDKLDVIARQIEATQILKQGLMQTLFSRGVGTQDATGRWIPHTEFKDSELGPIPALWDVGVIADYVSALRSGVSVNAEDRVHGDEEIGVLKVSCVLRGEFYPNCHKTVVPDERERVAEPVLQGRIIVSRANTPALVGESAYVDSAWPNLFLPDKLWQIEPSERPHSIRWLSFYLQSPFVRQEISKAATGTSGSMKNIAKPAFLSIRMPLVPLAEQEHIAAILSGVTSKISALSSKQGHYQTLKRGLMQKLLTGEWRVKLDSPSGTA